MIASEAPALPKLTRNEGLKANNPTLAGSIAQTLADPARNHFTEDDYEFLKFHGVYQQDDRDKRKVARDGNGGEGRTRQMVSVTCDSCGIPTEVPFTPVSGKPVYCSDCFRTVRPD